MVTSTKPPSPPEDTKIDPPLLLRPSLPCMKTSPPISPTALNKRTLPPFPFSRDVEPLERRRSAPIAETPDPDATVTLCAASFSLSPLLTMTAPDATLDDEPLETTTSPDDEMLLPEAKERVPPTPTREVVEPPIIDTAPPIVASPTPPAIDTLPPVNPFPLDKIKSPPLSLTDSPTEI